MERGGDASKVGQASHVEALEGIPRVFKHEPGEKSLGFRGFSCVSCVKDLGNGSERVDSALEIKSLGVAEVASVSYDEERVGTGFAACISVESC